MIYTEYETVYIVTPELPEDAFKGLNEKITGLVEKNQGIILELDDWGKRKLAYPIRKNTKGHYVVLHFLGPSQIVAELERNLRIEDHLLRFLTVKLGEDVDVDEKKLEANDSIERKRADAARRAAEQAANEPDSVDTDADEED